MLATKQNKTSLSTKVTNIKTNINYIIISKQHRYKQLYSCVKQLYHQIRFIVNINLMMSRFQTGLKVFNSKLLFVQQT